MTTEYKIFITFYKYFMNLINFINLTNFTDSSVILILSYATKDPPTVPDRGI